MTFGAKPTGAEALAHTVHIWPSQELIDRSWEWPEPWHAAYEAVASQIGRAVGVCVLGGLPVVEHPIELELPLGCVTFSVSVWATSIYISITAFEGPDGPDAPGPDGGLQQPRSADGLGLGLRGTGKYCQLVAFYGYLPPLPAGHQPLPGALCRALSGALGATPAGSRMGFMHAGHANGAGSSIMRELSAPGGSGLAAAAPARKRAGSRTGKRRALQTNVLGADQISSLDIASRKDDKFSDFGGQMSLAWGRRQQLQ